MEDDWIVMSGEFVGRKGVSLERLHTLCLVAEAGSIMAAAKGDPNRQSLFSRQLKELETALHLDLLDRTSSPHRLTPDARRLEALARELISGVERLLDEATDRPSAVSIGAGESIFHWLVLPLLCPVIDDKELRIRCQNLRSREIVEALRSRRIDIGILSARHQSADLSWRSLAKYGVIAVGKPGTLPAKEELKWSDLAGRSLAALEGSGTLRRRVDLLTGAQPKGPELKLECSSYPQVIEVCAEAGMIGLLPGVAKRAAVQAGLVVAKIDEFRDLEFELVLMWNPTIAAARGEVQEVISLLLGGSGS